MIIGGCPYCDALTINHFAKAGVCTIEKCEECNKEYALKHSRLDPIAYPMECVEVNKENKTIKVLQEEGMGK